MMIAHSLRLIGRGISLRPWGSLLTLVACWFALTQLLLVIFAVLIAGRTTLLPGTTGSMVAYLSDTVEQESAQVIREKIAELPEISGMVSIPREEGLQRIREWLGPGSSLTDGLDPSVLPNALEIKIKPQHEGEIARIAAAVEKIPGVGDVRYHRGILASIAGAFRTILASSVVISAVVIVCLSLVIFLSVRVGIILRRQEIEVLTILGARDSYLYAPYLLEAGMQALVGAALALAGVDLFITYLHARSDLCAELIPEVSLIHVVGVMSFACLCSLAGAVLALRKSIYE